MPIKLKVLSYKGLPLASELSVELGQSGGTIGRKSGNSLVLPDAENFVSGHHAEITSENGKYILKDISKNGTYLTNSQMNLNNAQIVLTNQETLRVGEYEIEVEITNELTPSVPEGLDSHFSFSVPEPFARELQPLDYEPLNFSSPAPQFDTPFIERPPASPFHDSFSVPDVAKSQNDSKDIADFLKGLDALGGVVTPVNEPDVPQLQVSRVVDSPFSAPFGSQSEPDLQIKSVADKVPDLTSKPAFEPASTPPEASMQGLPPISGAPIDNTLLQQFLEGAGVKDHTFLSQEQWPEAMKATGALFRNLIEGLMDVLRARAEMKSEFRVSVTTIRSFDNNPLKFNPDVESVLKLMLAPNNPAFINSNDAVSEAFKDIKYHQLAMTAGIQAALADIMQRFDPQGIDKSLGEGIVFQKKAKCWELYCEKYPELKAQALEEFFGEAFAEAYEKQMRLFSRR